MREAITFYKSFYEAIQEEEDPIKRLQAYEAILGYAFYDMEPENLQGIGKAVYILAKPIIDASNRNVENGKKGGRPKKDAKIHNFNERDIDFSGLEE